MRKLNKKQKRFLDTKKDMFNATDLELEEIELLEKMNDYETLFQDATRYLMDNNFKN